MSGRKQELEALEQLRENPVIAYVTGDRNLISGRISEDAVRPLFDILRAIGPVETLDLFIYSRGGALEVPWRIASALREYAKKWNILIPYRANSAATLLALGADGIVFGRHGELGPIDPTIDMKNIPGIPGSTPLQDSISVEDVMAYLRFIKEEVGLTDQGALSQGLSRLIQRLDAVGLGNVYRTRSHIRDVASRMLRSQQDPPSERIMDTISETLATRVYAHGHAIGFAEAKDIGLPVVKPPEGVEIAMWNLLTKYEEDLQLRKQADPAEMLGENENHMEEWIIAVVESKDNVFEFRGKLDINRVRRMPNSLNVSFALDVPPEIGDMSSDEDLQEMLARLKAELSPAAFKAVEEALVEQAPIEGSDIGFRGGNWISS